jgi:hypothetical protein
VSIRLPRRFESGWLLATEVVETSKAFVRESSMVPVYAILLFGGALAVSHERGLLTVDGWAQFKAPARIGVLVGVGFRVSGLGFQGTGADRRAGGPQPQAIPIIAIICALWVLGMSRSPSVHLPVCASVRMAVSVRAPHYVLYDRPWK